MLSNIYGVDVPLVYKNFHYVYRISDIVNKIHYYGKRSSKTYPYLDLGVKYISSSIDKNFIRDQKENPQNYKYKIIKIFASSRLACEYERKIHLKFDVSNNSRFYNRIISGGIPCLDNKVSVKNTFGRTLSVSKEIFQSDSSLAGVRRGKVSLFKDGKSITVDVESAEKHIADGWNKWMDKKTAFFDESGNIVILLVDEAVERNLKGVNHGKIPVIDSDGKSFLADIDDPRLISREILPLVGIPVHSTYKHRLSGETLILHKNDDRVLSGEYVGVTRGHKIRKEVIDKIKKTFSCPIIRKYHFAQSRLLIMYDVNDNVLFHIDSGTNNIEIECAKHGINSAFLKKYLPGEKLFIDIISCKTRGNLISIGKLNKTSNNWRKYIGCYYKLFIFNNRRERSVFIENHPEYKKFFDCI